METVLFTLKIICGVGIIGLFIFLILYTLGKNSSKFLRYLLVYLAFLGVIGFLFFIFPDATLYIALLAGFIWTGLVLKGSRSGGDKSPGQDDLE